MTESTDMARERRVYLDYNATTPPDPRVVSAMMSAMTECFGNPSNDTNVFGLAAADVVEHARQQAASLIGATPREVVFTSGATESCNLALKGAAEMYRNRGNHIVTCLSEHKAVIEPCRRLEAQGFDVTWLRPDEYGQVNPEKVAKAVTGKTILISIMAANNVVGTINPVKEIGQIAKRKGVLFHCDATQAVGKIPLDVEEMGIDLLSLSAHKLYGPKGVGALFVRSKGPRVRLNCQIDGGGQERGLRSGTLNVPGIVGMSVACEIASAEMGDEQTRISSLSNRLQDGLTRPSTDVVLNGHPRDRLPNTLNVSFLGIESAGLIQRLPNIAASVSSACTSGTADPHYVLRSMGIAEDRASGSIRFSLGRFTTADEIDYVIEEIAGVAGELQSRDSLRGLLK